MLSAGLALQGEEAGSVFKGSWNSRTLHRRKALGRNKTEFNHCHCTELALCTLNCGKMAVVRGHPGNTKIKCGFFNQEDLLTTDVMMYLFQVVITLLPFSSVERTLGHAIIFPWTHEPVEDMSSEEMQLNGRKRWQGERKEDPDLKAWRTWANVNATGITSCLTATIRLEATTWGIQWRWI